MENPDTWTEMEKTIHEAIEDWYRWHERGVIGWSLTKAIAYALREKGLANDQVQD